MTRTQRLDQISEVDYDFASVVPDVYRTFTTDGTTDFFDVLHRGLGLVSMQAALTTAEQTSCMSPEQVLPYRRVIWTPITAGSDGKWTADPNPYSILGVKRSVGRTEDWVDAAVYTRATGVVSGLTPGESYWIPEMLHLNPWIWTALARPLGVFPEDVPTGYSPAHLPPYLRVVREGIRGGTRVRTLRNMLSAAAGNPFAYVAGTVVSAGASGVVVQPATGDPVACEVPEGTSDLALVALGTVVLRHAPLVAGSVSVVPSGRTERAWGMPVDITTASGQHITLAAALPLGFGDRIRIRILSTGYDASYIVRRASGLSVSVEGDLPVLTGAEEAVAQRLDASPESTRNIAIEVASSYGNGQEKFVRALAARALPVSVGHTLTYA